jgi:hypothetical protein
LEIGKIHGTVVSEKLAVTLSPNYPPQLTEPEYPSPHLRPFTGSYPEPSAYSPHHNNGFFVCKGKAIPLEAWTGPESSRRLRLPEFKIIGTYIFLVLVSVRG